MWRRMKTVSDCAGSKTPLSPEEHGAMIINETGTAVNHPLSLATDSGYVFFFIILYIKNPLSRS